MFFKKKTTPPLPSRSSYFRPVGEVIRDAGLNAPGERGTDEARARAYGVMLCREYGAERASYLADQIVRQVQLTAREGADHSPRREAGE